MINRRINRRHLIAYGILIIEILILIGIFVLVFMG